MRLDREITYEEVVAQAHNFARLGLCLGVDPLEVLHETINRYGHFFGDHPDDLDDIVAAEVLRYRRDPHRRLI